MACKLTYKGQRFDTKQQLLKHLQMEGVLDQLMKTNLSKGYEIMSLEEIRNKLIELGVDADVAFQIIGEIGARNLDAFDNGNRLQNLEVAKQMQSENLDPLKIRLATGWELGVDGKWRYEVEPFNLKVSNRKELEELSKNNKSIPLGDIVDLKIFKQVYGESVTISNSEEVILNSFNNVRVILDKALPIGHAYYNNMSIHINPLSIEYNEDFSKEGASDNFNTIIAHELQHFIQVREGFSLPFSEEGFKFELNYEIDHVEKELKTVKSISTFEPSYLSKIEPLEEQLKELKKLKNLPQEELDNRYWVSSGEVEARNVQSRINMSPEQRRNTLLSSTEDILRSDQIVQFQKQGVTLLPNGFYHNGKVYINQDLADLSTPIHEFSHAYNQLLKNERPEFYKEGLNLIEKEGKQYIDFVKANQPNLQGEALLEEALAQAVGDAGAKLIEAEKSTGLKQWLQNAWNKIKEMLGLSSYTTEQELQQIKDEAIANGTFMKAPNGKDTNLNERQWLQVRSKNFRSWFGDFLNDPQNASKVVDENGEPLIVLHGNRVRDLKEFNRSKNIAKPSGLKEYFDYFTTNRKLAEKYATKLLSPSYTEQLKKDIGAIRDKQLEARTNTEYYNYEQEIEALRRKTSPTIHEVFLNIRNPYEFNAEGLDSTNGFKKGVLNIGHKTVSGRANITEAVSGNRDDYNSPYDGIIVRDIADMESSFLNGYSDSEIKDRVKDYVGDVFATIAPNQIKFATDNVGTFSSETNDIRYQIGLEQQKIENKIKEFNHINNIGLKITVDQDKLKSVKEDIDSCSI